VKKKRESSVEVKSGLKVTWQGVFGWKFEAVEKAKSLRRRGYKVGIHKIKDGYEVIAYKSPSAIRQWWERQW